MQILNLPSNTCLNGSESRASDPMADVLGSMLMWGGGHILLLDFLFSHYKSCESNIAIIANFG